MVLFLAKMVGSAIDPLLLGIAIGSGLIKDKAKSFLASLLLCLIYRLVGLWIGSHLGDGVSSGNFENMLAALVDALLITWLTRIIKEKRAKQTSAQ